MEENVKRAEPRSRLYWRQLLTTLSPLLSMFILGLTYGFGTVIMSELISHKPTLYYTPRENNTFGITDSSQTFWITPGNIVSMIPTCLLSGFMMEKLGRRKLFILAFPLFTISWVVMGSATTLYNLTIGRLIGSMAGGLIIPLVPVYLAEISDPVIRGVLLSMISAALSLGVLISTGLTILTLWRGNAYICAMFSLIGWLSCLGCRESPIWLMNEGHYDLAVKQWVHLRGQGSMNEYRAMERVRNTHSEENGGNGRSESCWPIKDIFSRHFLWPLATTCILSFTREFSGFNMSQFFVLNMLMVIGIRAEVLAYTFTMSIMLVVNIGVSCLMLRCKRRTLAMVSSFGTMCTLFLANAFFFFVEFFWFIWIFAAILLLCVGIGLSPLSWVFVGELFPGQLRSLGASVACAFGTACMFADLILCRILVERVDPTAILLIYGAVAMAGTALLYWKLPESKEKTLLEIETIFDEEETEPTNIEMVECEV